MQRSERIMANQWQHDRVAIVYDQATTRYGGAELVLAQLRRIFPKAHLFSTIVDAAKATWTHEWKTHTSFVQQCYRLVHRHEPITPLLPLAIESLSSQLADYQLIISVSAGVAKGVITKPNQLHVCYLLTPTRYLYEPSPDYLQAYGAWKVARFLRLDRPLLRYLTRWDQVAGQRPDRVIAISELVADRIEDIYGRKTDKTIFPPIPKPIHVTAGSMLPADVQPFTLCVSRLVWYKRIDVVVESVLEDPSLPTLVVAGSGSEERALKQQAGYRALTRTNESVSDILIKAQQENKRVVFLGNCTAQEKAELFTHAAVFIMPGVEDFGLTAIEAASYGLASLIHATSGVAEVLNSSLAYHLNDVSSQGIAAGIKQLMRKPVSKSALIAAAKRHYPDEFANQIISALEDFKQEQLQKTENVTEA